MPYAERESALSRAGKVAPAWTAENAHPGVADLEKELKIAAAEIDAKLSARGITVPFENEDAAAALEGLNADMALLVLLPATYVKDMGAVSELKNACERRVDDGLLALEAGTHSAVLILERASTSAAESGSLWDQRVRGPAFRRSEIL